MKIHKDIIIKEKLMVEEIYNNLVFPNEIGGYVDARNMTKRYAVIKKTDIPYGKLYLCN